MDLTKKPGSGPKPPVGGKYGQAYGRMDTSTNGTGQQQQPQILINYQPSNTKLKYDRIKLRSRQKYRQQLIGPGGGGGQATRSLSNSSQALKSDDFVDYDDDDDDEMLFGGGGASTSGLEGSTSIKNAKSLGYLTSSSISNAPSGSSSGGRNGRQANGGGNGSSGSGGDEDRMRRSLSNYTCLNGSTTSGAASSVRNNGGGGSGFFYRDSGSRHSLKPLSISNGSLNSNWYKPKSLQLPPASNQSSTNLEMALNGPSETTTATTTTTTTKTGW